MDDSQNQPASPATVATSPSTDEEWIGRTLGEFQIVRLLGRGGMGQVFLAEQRSLKRKVALKILRPDLAANQTSLQRFQKEAQAVARITHANIVQIYAINEQDGVHYMALEYVEGRNLRDYLNRKGPPELPAALNIMKQIGAALQRAGEHGFVHRDIKPENILITRKGEVKVADFGLSRCFAEDQPAQNVTQSGVAMGTPLYMSPEQVQGKPLDQRSDIYSFGVTAYHMLSGQPPFRGNSAFDVALQHVQSEPPPLVSLRPDLPPELCALVHKMMAKNPEERFQSARDIVREVNRVREGLGGGSPKAATAPSDEPAQPAVTMSISANLPMSDLGPTTPIQQRNSGRLLLAVLAGIALLGVAGAGVVVRVLVNRLAAHNTTAAPSANAEQRPIIANEERIALEAAHRFDNPKPADFGRGLLDQIDLFVYYLSRNRLDDAEKFTRSLQDRKYDDLPPGMKLKSVEHPYKVFARFAHGLTLAWRDEAQKSLDALAAALQRNQQGMALNLVGMPQPVYHFELRRLTAEALNRDAANLKIKEFTGDKYGHLEQLRKPPEQPKRGGPPPPKK